MSSLGVLFEDGKTRVLAHADRLVEPVRAGRAGRVHSEPDPRPASVAELLERTQEQRTPDPTRAVTPAYPENANPSELGVNGVPVAYRETHRLVSD